MLQLEAMDFIFPTHNELETFNAYFWFSLANIIIIGMRGMLSLEHEFLLVLVDKCSIQLTHGNRDIIMVHNLPCVRNMNMVHCILKS
jgi:hypothetical protein